jgi:lysophospholipase L1-like esterase
MNRVSAAFALIGVLSLSSLVGCSSSSSTTINQTQLTYTAIGASDAVGVGATQCATAGSPPMPSPPSCPGGTGYVPVLAQLLTSRSVQVNLFDLGISGAVIGPDIETDTAACFGAPGNFITNELPVVNAQSGIVTVFAGGNDTNAIVACAVGIVMGGGDPTAFINAEIAKFGADYASLIAGIKAASPPGVVIIVANLPNFALIPVGTTQPAGVKALLDEVSTTLDKTIINPSAGVTVSAVIDLLCDPRSYNVANFSADGFHPNAAGYQILAQSYHNQYIAVRLGAPVPPLATCPPFSTAALRQPMTATDAAGAHLWRY